MDCKLYSCLNYSIIPRKHSHRNTAQVSGGERELRTNYLKPFNRACVEAFSIMTAYSSYDGVPAIANKRKDLSTENSTGADLITSDLLTEIVCFSDITRSTVKDSLTRVVSSFVKNGATSTG